MAQTTVKDSNTIRFGSGKLEVGPDINSLVDLGAMRGIVFTEEWEVSEITSDNAGVLSTKIRNHKAAVEGDLMEINLTNLNTIRGGIDNYSTTSGDQVVGHSYVVASGAWKYDKFIPLNHQMHDLSKITPTSVTAGTNGALVVNTDYFIVQDAGSGKWGIVVRDSATVTTEDQNLTIVFTYTPAATKVLKTGGKQTITPKVIRITNTNAAGKTFVITIFKAANAQGITLTLESDDSEEPNIIPIKLQGTLDVTRTAGEQLFEIVDSQAA